MAAAVPQIVVWSRLQEQTSPRLAYLDDKNTELSVAVQRMVRRSTWSRWYAAHNYSLSGKAVDERRMLFLATTLIGTQLVDGTLVVIGRRPGSPYYEIIPPTYWRTTRLHFAADRSRLWKMHLVPPGGISRENNKAGIAGATQGASRLATYESLLINSHQFEKLWPATDRQADKELRKFLKKARRKAPLRRIAGGERDATTRDPAWGMLKTAHSPVLLNRAVKRSGI